MSRQTDESPADRLLRVQHMARDAYNAWDLSLNDRAALETVLADRDALLAAAKVALHEMCHTVAPRTSFTDAVDGLDAAIAHAEGAS